MASPVRTHSRIRIALADHHVLFRNVVAALLSEQAGVEVVGQCGDGLAVMDLIARTHPDVLLLDLELPRVDGLEVLRRLAVSETRTRPLVLTGLRESARLSQALEMGARGIISKRSATQQLIEAIQMVSAGLRWIDPSLPIPAARPRRHSARDLARSRPREARSRPSWGCLTPRERQVAGLVARGARYKDVARELNISNHTVKNHLRNIFGKLDIRNRVQLALIEAEQHGNDAAD